MSRFRVAGAAAPVRLLSRIAEHQPVGAVTLPPLPALAPGAASAAAVAASRNVLRNDWTRPEIQAIYDSPLMDLLFYGVRLASAAWPSPPAVGRAALTGRPRDRRSRTHRA